MKEEYLVTTYHRLKSEGKSITEIALTLELITATYEEGKEKK